MLALRDDARAELFNINLADAHFYWRTVLSTERVPFERGAVVSRGPYHIDMNHRESALLVGPLGLRVAGPAFEGRVQTSFPTPDLTNTTARIRLKFDYEPSHGEYDVRKGGRLVFWFQATLPQKAVAGGDFEMPPRYANYVFNRNLLAEAEAGITVEVQIKPDLNQWTCLGRNPIDTRDFIGSAAKYTCAINQDEFAEAMAQPESLGILFLLPSAADDGDPLKWLDEAGQHWSQTEVMAGATFTLTELSIIPPRRK